MKQHLAQVKGSISKCLSVPGDVKFLIQGSLDENAEKAKEKRAGDTSGMNFDDEDDEVQILDYESIDKIDFWVVDEIPEGELNYNDLENMIEEELPNYNESTTFDSQASQENEEDDDGVALEEPDMDSFR